jgi:hypothetical protein
MDLSDRIAGFARLGEFLKEALHEAPEIFPGPESPPEVFFKNRALSEVSVKAREANPWFVHAFNHCSLAEIGHLLERRNLEKWTSRYPFPGLHPENTAVVGTILAGNIPLVGFHDFLSILISGHRFKGKLSGKDEKLLPFLAGKLIEFEPRFGECIRFEDSKLGGIDAIIATGSDNSSRYFEHYFGKYPHIFRKNRNGIAVLTGRESQEELDRLSEDVFLFFGLGCRNVSKLYVPEGYSFDPFYRAVETCRTVIDHHKYANNYQYHRSVYLMNRIEHLDNGFLLLRPDPALSSPVGTLHYTCYSRPEDLIHELQNLNDSIQCIASHDLTGISSVAFGATQHPELWDYADGVDTLKFLINLYEN